MARLTADALSYADFTLADLENRLKLLNYNNLKRDSGRTISILTDGNRLEVLQLVEEGLRDIQAVYDPNKGSSSLGAVTVGQFTIKARPASKQGNFSAGIQNELLMIKLVKQYTAGGPINIRITDGVKNKLYKDIAGIEEMGRDTVGRKKADINLVTTSNQKIPISIKKDNAETWESADSYWASKAKDIIDSLEQKNKIDVTEAGSVFKIKPSVAKAATAQEKTDVVFGSDILQRRGCVLVKTFNQRDFNIVGDELVITGTKVIDSVTDLTGKYEIFFLIRNDSSRRGSKIRPGLRVLAVQSTRINRNVLVV